MENQQNQAVKESKFNPIRWLRTLYDWVLHWAETPYGVPALFVLSFAEASFFPIPPDVLLIALAVAIPKKAFRFALYCTIASVSGAMLGYLIGFYFYDAAGSRIIEFYGIKEQFDYVALKYNENAFSTIAIAGFTPIPFKVFTIAAGVFHVNISELFFASVLSRGARFFLLSGLIYRFGPSIKLFIDRYFNKLAVTFVFLLFLGFFAVRYLF